MKTHPHLLVRDALAAVFVAASAGEREACEIVDELAGWAEGHSPGPGPERLRSEDGSPLLEADGSVAKRFAALESYIRDRARRFSPACEWLRSDGLEGDPLERARAAWDAGLFFEVHEILEPIWAEAQGEQRTTLQALIMAGAAMHHLVEGNMFGARGLLRDAAARLADAARHERLDLESFGAALATVADAIDAKTVSRVEDLTEIPRLETRDAGG